MSGRFWGTGPTTLTLQARDLDLLEVVLREYAALLNQQARELRAEHAIGAAMVMRRWERRVCLLQDKVMGEATWRALEGRAGYE